MLPFYSFNHRFIARLRNSRSVPEGGERLLIREIVDAAGIVQFNAVQTLSHGIDGRTQILQVLSNILILQERLVGTCKIGIELNQHFPVPERFPPVGYGSCNIGGALTFRFSKDSPLYSDRTRKSLSADVFNLPESATITLALLNPSE